MLGILQGFLCGARCRRQLFSAQCVATIFSNIELIHDLSAQLLLDMQDACLHSAPYDAQLGYCFLKHVRLIVATQ